MKKFSIDNDGVITQVKDIQTIMVVDISAIDDEIKRSEQIIETLKQRIEELLSDKKEIESLISGGKKKAK